MKHQLSQLSVVMALVTSSTLMAADWGNLKATFVLDGAAPSPKALSITKDQQVCGKHNLVDERLVVNKANKGIANIVVYLYVGTGDKKPPVHDSYKESEKGDVQLDNANCRFEPHVTLLRTTQTLIVGNPDPVAHNTNFPTFTRNAGQNVLVPASGQLKINLTAAEPRPAQVQCNIHPWMMGWLVVQDHPYMAVSDEDGKITINNLPAGKWTFQVWQEAAGYVTKVKRKNKAENWTRGRVELDIKKGDNDLGEILVPVSSFKLN